MSTAFYQLSTDSSKIYCLSLSTNHSIFKTLSHVNEPRNTSRHAQTRSTSFNTITPPRLASPLSLPRRGAAEQRGRVSSRETTDRARRIRRAPNAPRACRPLEIRRAES